MAMQMNTQQIPVVSEQTQKPGPPSPQAVTTGTPTRSQGRSTFPADSNQQTRPTWAGLGNAVPTVSAGPPLVNTYPGVTSPGQGGALNYSGMVSPGGVLPLPTRSVFPRDAGMPYSPFGFPPPPPYVMDPMGMTGAGPEV